VCARAVIFDWDGTLLNSFRADMRAYGAMFRVLGIEFSDLELAHHYSPDWYRVYRAAGIPKAKWNLADRLWAVAYRKENPRLIPGVRTVLNKLNRSFALGLVTSGDRKRVVRQLRQFGFQGLFAICVCSEDASCRKPHPAPLRTAMRCMRMSAADCVYVGDTPEDIEMARRAGVRSVGIVGPFPSSARLKAMRPGMLLKSIRDLPKVLCSARRAL
jgi:HAD superfamily hydrolase (TIGR01549 family)